MDWPTLYLPLRHLHITLATASVAFFALRGAAVLAGASWPKRRAVRRTSALIDTLLLAAGGTLWWLLQLNPGRDRWLLVKLVLIVVYIGLGTLAIDRLRGTAARVLAYAAALACIAAVAAIALAHDAKAPLRWLGL